MSIYNHICMKYLKIVILFLLVSNIISCNSKEIDPLITHSVRVSDSSRDTIMVIKNEKLSKSASITVNSALSDSAIVQISSDTLFSQRGGFLIPMQLIQSYTITDLEGEFLYIKYKPIRNTTFGDVTINITYGR